MYTSDPSLSTHFDLLPLMDVNFISEERPNKRKKTSDTAPCSIIHNNCIHDNSYSWWRDLHGMVFEHPDPDNKIRRRELIEIYISIEDSSGAYTSTSASIHNDSVSVSGNGSGVINTSEKGTMLLNYRYRSGMIISEKFEVTGQNRSLLHRRHGDEHAARANNSMGRTIEILRNSFDLIIGLKPFENDVAFIRRR